MPVLDFQAEDGEIISVYVKINEPREAFQVHTRESDKKVFKRVFASPHVSTNMLAGDDSKDDFARMTEGKNDTVGQMWERSKEMSQRRASKNNGVDPVMEKFYSNYEKKFRAKHPDVLKREKAQEIERLRKDWGVHVEI